MLRGPRRVVCVAIVLVLCATIDPAADALFGRASSGLAAGTQAPRIGPAPRRTPPRDGLSSGRLRAADARKRHAAPGKPDRALVEVFHTLSDPAARARVEHAGGVVTGAVPGVLVQAEVPWGRLERLEGSDGITFVRPPRRIDVPVAPSPAQRRRARSKAIGSEVAKTGADVWHAAGLRGAGVKIGIIDVFSGRKYNAARRAKQVPRESGTVCFVDGAPCDVFKVSGRRQAHGTAVAEIVHEMAPDAQLFLASAFTASDLQAVVDTFVAQGVKIVTRSLTSEYDGPGDGTGAVDAVIDDAVARGITWFNSAGNSAGEGEFPFSGAYYRGGFSDPDNDGLHDFAPGVEALGLPCFSFTHGLRWDDFGEPAADVTDFDLIQVDADGNLLDEARDQQGSTGGTAPPLENFDAGGTSCSSAGRRQLVFVAIQLIAAGSDASDVLEFQNNGQPMTFWSNPFSAAVPACDSANPGAVCVGAVDPALGTAIASYSSRGPTNDARIKPDVSAPACVVTFSFRSCFNGTSASTPVTAGAAALLLGANLAGAQTAAGLADLVRASIVDRGPPGPDNDFGTGELLLPPPTAP
jgi:hypothetical protein